MDPKIQAAIAKLAYRQQGNVTRQQLLDLGLGREAIKSLLRTRRMFRVYRGVYAVGRPPRTNVEWAAAAALACGPGAALSHFSALALWGFVKEWPTRPEVTLLRDRRPAGIKLHAPTTLHRSRELTTNYGIRVTSPARTLLDCAPHMSEKALTRAVNDGLLSNRLQRSALEELLGRHPRHPGANRLRPFVHTDDGPTRSEFEDDFLDFCKRFGLPRPTMAAKVGRYTVDALFEAERVIVELDGYRFHSSRESFESDRARDVDTLALGYETARLTWGRLTESEADRLRAILRARRGGR
jgi:hypothetical protein